ncbi:hypothetical protein BD413DRAFT_181118 [Trametes elegans]|nr:hypothetical protein BD413DRAFT_181118 [Trametes elegans]
MRSSLFSSQSSPRLPVYHRLDLEDGPDTIPTSSPTSTLRRYRRSLTFIAIVFSFGLLVTLLVSLDHPRWPRRPPPPLLPQPHAPPSEARNLLSTSLPAFLAHHPELPSGRWAPISMSTCLPGMAPYLSPCLAERRQGAVFGEELIYPDFRIREPLFAPARVNDDAPEWRKLLGGIKERGALCEDGKWVCYRGQTGQNIVLVNATFNGNPPADNWSDNACMSDGVTTAGLETAETNASTNMLATPGEYDEAFPTDALLIATSPDSWSFQHFLDRVTHIVMQGAHLTLGHPPPDVVTGRSPGPAVSEMWEMLGMEGSRIHYGTRRIAAKAIIFSCRSPLIHPWPSLRTLETFGLNPDGVPLDERKKIVYFSRSHGQTTNGGRRVLNEKQLLNEIRGLLDERGQGEELVLFHDLGFHSQRDLMEWFHKNVRAVVGPHGGGLYNHRWTGKDTLVLEMMSQTYTSLMFWEEASTLGQVYATTFLPPASGTDMIADIPAMLEIMRRHLGKPDPRGPSLRRMYRWHAEELMVEEP